MQGVAGSIPVTPTKNLTVHQDGLIFVVTGIGPAGSVRLKNKPSLGTVYSIQNKIATITKMTNPSKMYRAIVKEFVCVAMRSVLHICAQKNIGMISQIYLISCEIWCKISAI